MRPLKRRYWVTATIIISVLLALYGGWRTVGLNQRARQFLATKGIRAEKVSVGLGVIRLEGVTFETKSPVSAFQVENAQITYSLWRLLLGGAHSALRHLSFSQPVLVLQLDKLSGRIKTPETIFAQLPPGRYTFTGGSVRLLNPSGKLTHQIPLADKIKGWILSTSDGEITLGIEGRLLSDKTNAKLAGSFVPRNGSYNLKLAAKGIDLSSLPPKLFSPGFSLKSGKMDLSLSLQDKARTYGWIKVKDTSLRLASLPAGEVNGFGLTAQVRPDTVIIKKGRGIWNEAEFQIKGQVTPLSPPGFSLELGVSHLKIREVASVLGLNGKTLPAGDGSLSLKITGFPHQLLLKGVFDRGTIFYNTQQLKDLRVKFTKTRSFLVLQEISGKVGGGRLQGKLKLGIHGDIPLEGEFNLTQVDFARIARLLNVDTIAGHGNLRIRLQGNWRSPYWQVWYDSQQLSVGGHNLHSQKGELELGPQGVRIHSSWGEGEFFASSPRSFKHSLWRVNQQLFALGKTTAPLRGKIALTGRISSIESTGRVNLGGNEVDLNGKLTAAPGGIPALQLLLNSSDFSLAGYPSTLTLTALADSTQGNLRLIVTDKKSGQLVLKETLVFKRGFPLDFLHFYRMVSAKVKATLDGALQLSGTLPRPVVSAWVTAQQGCINDLHSLKAELSLRWDKQQGLEIEKCVLFHRSDKLLSVKGNWGKIKSVNAEARAIDVTSFLSLFHPLGKKITGKLSYNIRLFEHKDSPRFDARLFLFNAHLVNVPFDKISGTIRGDPTQIQEVSLQLVKKKSYQGSLQGTIPFGAKGKMKVKFKLHGNILSALSCLTDQIRRGSGNGEIELQLGGKLNSPLIERFATKFEQGELSCRFLSEKIEELKGSVSLASDSDFLWIKDISGKLGGGKFIIKNYKEKKLDGEELTPLVIEPLGINLGIIALRTGEAGIKLNIPGLMKPKEEGRFRFLSPNQGEGLYFTGPVQSPQLKGVCYVNDVEFTFPPLKSQRSSSSSSFSQFLKSINWDFKVVMGRNVHYFRRQVYSITDIGEVDLLIDEGAWLSFKSSVTEGKLYVQGDLQSHQGKLIYLNTEFDVEEIGFLLNTRNDPMPLVWGSAKTTVYSDTTGVPTDIFLHLYAIDKQTGQRKEKGRWGELRMELTSSDPNDNTPEKILAKLGYSLDNYNQKAAILLTTGMEKILLGTLIRPVERKVRKTLRLDVFSLHPSVMNNLLTNSELLLENGNRLSYLAFLRGTEWTLGEYFLTNWFLFYTGELKAEKNQYQRETLGIKHCFGIEYRTRNTNISFEYNYDDILKHKDKQFAIRRYFSF